MNFEDSHGHTVVYRHCETKLKGISDDPQGGMTMLACPECGERMHVKVIGWPNSDWPYSDGDSA